MGWATWVVTAAVVALVLGPLAWPGYVLSYDLVFVPRQPLTWESLAPADALPRAVPLDMVISLLNIAIPGWLLERIALAGLLVAAMVGAARLVPTARTAPRLVAAVGYGWSPFLAERLLLGQWALLCCYAALPWLVLAATRLRAGHTDAWPRLVLAAAAAALTPTGGVIAVVVTATLLLGRWGGPSGRGSGRTRWGALVAVGLLNVPWLVASVVSGAGGRSDPAGVAAFAARAENWSGVVGALLGTGGSWNRWTTPDSRAWTVTPLVTVALLTLAVAGWPLLRSRLPAGLAGRLAWLAAGGFVLAGAGATTPGAAALRFLVAHVPGGGLLRDGQKFLIPYVLLLVLAAACGAERAGAWLTARAGAQAGGVLLVSAVLLPVLAMPDLAWGGFGALRPVSYPPEWATVARLVAASPGQVLVLPFAEYRRYGFNHGRTVIDPWPRYLAAPVLADDTLIVDGQAIPGENRRAAAVHAHLAAGGAAAELGVEWVVVVGPGVPASALSGLATTFASSELTLYHNPHPAPVPQASTSTRMAMIAAYAVALGCVLAAAVAALARWRAVASWRRRARA